MKIAIAFGILLAAGVGLLVTLSYVQEGAREALEDGHYCDTYRVVKWTSLASKDAKQMLGFLFAGGFCVGQDIGQAKDLYASVFGNEPTKIGEKLFYDALEVSEADERTGKAKRPQVLQTLFAEAAKTGFQPTEKDLAELEQRNLRGDYLESVGSPKPN